LKARELWVIVDIQLEVHVDIHGRVGRHVEGGCAVAASIRVLQQ
jgi:hypothetical protein